MSTPLPEIAKQSRLSCHRLPSFDAENWDAVRAALAFAPSCEFAQHWLSELQPRFLPGCVRVGYDDDSLWVYAEMQDADIFNEARELNQHAYKHGDVFEVFLRPLSGEPYIEFHVTPENDKLPLWFARARKSRFDPDWKLHYLPQTAFASWTQVLPQENLWRVLVKIPFATLALSTPAAGDEWLFSFGRYDYTRGKKRPVVSSTSPHRFRDFHRLHEWGKMVFEAETVTE